MTHAVWLSCRLRLSDREIEEWLCKRGSMVTCAAIPQWCGTFGQSDAHQRRRRRPRPGDHWHLDEVVLTIHGRRYDLWRPGDQDANVLDILVPSRRNKRAVKTCFKKLLKGLPYVPRVIIMDQLKRDAAARGDVGGGTSPASLAQEPV
jgi:putative transposase